MIGLFSFGRRDQHNLGGTCSTNLKQLKFAGQVAGTIFWSLSLDFLMKMGSSRGLVVGTSPFVCAEYLITDFLTG